MSTGHEPERRQSFRIEDTIYLEYRRVEKGEETQEELGDDAFTNACRMMQQIRDLDRQSDHVLGGIRKQHGELAQYLSLLERKVEALARMVSAIGLGPDIQPNTRANIGSGGMAFDTSEALEKGEQLLLKVVLFPSHLCLQLLARVAYSHGDGAGSYLTGLTFEDISEQRQDALIQHLLEVQSAQLREERGKT